MNGKDVIKRLQAEGWYVTRIQGSHTILSKQGKAVPIPVHGTRDIGAGLLAAISRQTGVKLR
jgi:predicted RNA binding protein YcfA (HicA-like mRNA interferase family)